MSFALMLILFLIGYACIALEHPIKVNKSATALILAALIWTVYAVGGSGIFDITNFGEGYRTFIAENPDKGFMDFLTTQELIHHLGSTAEILFFLLGAMTIVEVVDHHQGFSVVTDLIKTKSERKLLWVTTLMTFFMSAVLDNLTTSIVMVAVLRKLVANKHDRWFFAGLVILAANAGGAWSPIGDVTTIMLWIGGKVTTLNIMLKTFIPSLLSLIVPLCILSFIMKGEVHRPEETNKEGVKLNVPVWQRRLMLMLGVGALLFVPVFKTLTHLPPYLGVLLGLGVVWVTTEILHRKDAYMHDHLNVMAVLRKVDVPSVLFFLGILMAVASLQSAGHLAMLSNALDTHIGRENYALIDIIIGSLSAVVDNVPLVAGTMGMYSLADFPVDHAFWELLAYCAGTGGSMLIIGSAAGVAVMGMEKIDFIWYLKRISIWALVGYLAGAGVYILLNQFVYMPAHI